MHTKEISITVRELATIPNVAALCFLLLTLAPAGRYGFYGENYTILHAASIWTSGMWTILLWSLS